MNISGQKLNFDLKFCYLCLLYIEKLLLSMLMCGTHYAMYFSKWNVTVFMDKVRNVISETSAWLTANSSCAVSCSMSEDGWIQFLTSAWKLNKTEQRWSSLY